MFSGKITTTCSIGVAAAGSGPASGDDALDIEMPRVAAPRASTATSAAKTFLRVRKADSPLASFGRLWRRIAPLPPMTKRATMLPLRMEWTCHQPVTEPLQFCDCCEPPVNRMSRSHFCNRQVRATGVLSRLSEPADLRRLVSVTLRSATRRQKVALPQNPDRGHVVAAGARCDRTARSSRVSGVRADSRRLEQGAPLLRLGDRFQERAQSTR